MIAAGSLRVFLAVSLAAASLCPGAWASAWALDPSATRIEFSVRNLSVTRVDGTLRLASGHVTLDADDPSRSTVEAVIDAASVDMGEAKRDAHLRSAEFLDVARYPPRRDGTAAP
jgi:polyisoprenoid-binding protein YceI